MKQNEELEILLDLLNKGGLSVDSHQKEQIIKYLNLVYDWGKKINLVSRADLNSLLGRHIFPSSLYALLIKKENVPERILDFGTGAGFPGVLLAILLEETKLTLLDSNRKKCLFLRQVRKNLSLSFSVVNERLEQWAMRDKLRFPVITARAVASLPELIEYVRTVLSVPGYLLVVKGSDYLEELKEYTPRAAVRIAKLDVPQEWVEFNPYLKNKHFIKVEFVNA